MDGLGATATTTMGLGVDADRLSKEEMAARKEMIQKRNSIREAGDKAYQQLLKNSSTEKGQQTADESFWSKLAITARKPTEAPSGGLPDYTETSKKEKAKHKAMKEVNEDVLTPVQEKESSQDLRAMAAQFSRLGSSNSLLKGFIKC